MSFKRYIFLVKSDLYRYYGNAIWRMFFYCFLLIPGFKYSFWMRTCSYFRSHPIFRYGFFHLARLILLRYEYKFGISISYTSKIGSGFYIGHFGGIVVSPTAIIGDNCNISQQVTIGTSPRGKHMGCPVIGRNVYIGPGAKIIGGIHIGDNVAIGANCVVTKDAPSNAVVVGIPGAIISFAGSNGYIAHTDYRA